MELFLYVIAVLLVAWPAATWRGLHRPMPTGLSVQSPLLPIRQLRFCSDLTYLNDDGKLQCEQHILAELLQLIGAAERFIILDIFLYNDLHDGSHGLAPLSRIVTDALLAAKKKRPGLQILLISDPVNTGYGSYANPYFNELQSAGATVVLTNLACLPDSNIPYAGFWNLLGRWVGHRLGRLPSPFAGNTPHFSLAGWLALLNFKANHRKVILSEKSCLLTSANNSHDASTLNSNIAFSFSGPLLAEIAESETAVAALAGRPTVLPPVRPASGGSATEECRGQLLTEGKIKAALLDDLEACRAPASLWLAMFYLADRRIVAALLAAARRGVTVRLILDANHDAFGRTKNGVPNRPVATWLHRKSAGGIQIRWYDSHGEQFHSKLVLLTTATHCMILGGSANLTRRNIDDFNLESCLRIITRPESDVTAEVRDYFERLWHNRGGHFTVDYQRFADHNLLRYWQYRIQESSGLGLF